ncbi:4-hydroxythreonine-4-phosphate dehydrogenase PdxA [Janthinobacterium sp. B9-8]|uniref:4-hydroxythreonine-4-phosphate dehydrogenase PdxA n=1 Tax=Janthinobacterium sp. B9-8 TaxID=1236179 RepID=UPI00061D09A0|nr:4-hydroxythreonine-4-phosphate dehydrogenase PdxA [Janthinobacterium sp. B9-8]AMC36655.1 4-hydroxythreonine-4-phosphate dehydrogenase [Janthinobacterium sp. B9-8]
MNKPTLPRIALTSGEPAGIGPEISAMLAASTPLPCQLVILCDKTLLQSRAKISQIDANWPDYSPTSSAPISILHIPLAAPCTAGKLNTANARYVLDLLDRACDGCQSGEFSAMVTAPIHKGVINEGGALGRFFYGHTEYLAERTQTQQVVMMLACSEMRVALATTHLPLKDVAPAITAESLTCTLRILYRDLQTKFGITKPRIIVAGLNPHAGESGHLGREEIEIISPVLEALRQTGMTLIGPLPADTLFNRNILDSGDAVLAMYHDQGLPVLKYASFGHGINITLGLPIIRTSVDHGTAIDLAGTGTAEAGSLLAATQLAIELSGNAI